MDAIFKGIGAIICGLGFLGFVSAGGFNFELFGSIFFSMFTGGYESAVTAVEEEKNRGVLPGTPAPTTTNSTSP